MKREVRQRCFFGCIICGSPIWDYDHVVEYSEVQGHTADNLVLLCPTHHAEKTRGMISSDTIRKFQEQPKNSTDEFSGARSLLKAGTQAGLIVGSNILAADVRGTDQPYFVGVWVNGKILLGAQIVNGFILFDLVMVDKIGNVILKIERGNVVVATGSWDVKWVGKRLEIRSSEHSIDASIIFDQKAIRIERGRLVDELGSGIEVRGAQLVFVSRGVDQSTVMGSVFLGGLAAIAVVNVSTGINVPSGANFAQYYP
jgi:hypothetical protein